MACSVSSHALGGYRIQIQVILPNLWEYLSLMLVGRPFFSKGRSTNSINPCVALGCLSLFCKHFESWKNSISYRITSYISSKKAKTYIENDVFRVKTGLPNDLSMDLELLLCLCARNNCGAAGRDCSGVGYLPL